MSCVAKSLLRFSKTACLSVALVSATALVSAPSWAQSLELSGLLQEQEERPQFLQRFPASADKLRFQGEYSQNQFSFFATGEEALKYQALQLEFLSAISVMPEASEMNVTVNGVAVGQVRLEASQDPRKVQLALPRGLVVEGYNQVKMQVSQRHRVDCSIPATYELWTSILPENSGLVYDLPSGEWPATAVSNLNYLRAIPPDASGATQFRLLTSPQLGRGNLDRSLAVAQVLAAAGGYMTPKVSVTSKVGTEPGIDIVVGTIAELEAMGVLIANKRLLNDGLYLMREPKTGRLVMYVFAANRGALDERVAQLEKQFQDDKITGTSQGIASFKNLRGLPIEDGAEITFADAGLENLRFDGRLLRVSMPLNLPQDFLAASYGKFQVKLDTQTLRELAPGNPLQIFANSKVLASTLLPEDTGMSETLINIPMSGLSAGRNDIVIELSTASAEDEACDVVAHTINDRISLSAETSSLSFSELATARIVPDLNESTLLPQGDFTGQPTWVQVPADDAASLQAAASIVTVLAASTGVVQPVSLLGNNVKVGNEPGLIVAPRDRLAGEGRSVIQRSLDGEQDSGIELWLKKHRGQTGLAATAASFVDTLGQGLRYAGFKINLGERKSTPGEISEDALFFAQGATELGQADTWKAFIGQPVRQDVWTIVTANSSDVLKEGVETLLQKGRLSWLQGDTSVFRSNSGSMTSWRIREPVHFAKAQDLSAFQNTRLVAAGVVSDNILDFCLAMIAMVLLLGVVYFLTLRSAGRR